MGDFGTACEGIGGKNTEKRGKKIDIRVKNQELRKKKWKVESGKWKEVRSTKLEIIPFKLWI